MGSCLGSLNHAAPCFCLVLLRSDTKSVKSLADLAGDLWCEPLNAWPCKDSFHREVLSPSSVNWKTIAAEMTELFNLLYVSLYQERLGSLQGDGKEVEDDWARMHMRAQTHLRLFQNCRQQLAKLGVREGQNALGFPQR